MIRNCVCCNYSTVYKQVFEKHLQSKRHIELVKNENVIDNQYNEYKSESIERSSLFSCSCGKKFTSYSVLRKHNKECIPTDNTLVTNNSNENIHSDVIPIILQYLNKLKNPLSNDVSGQNENIQVLECDQKNTEDTHLKCTTCNKNFATRSGLWKHKKTHTKNKPIITITNTDIISPIILEKLNELQLQITPLVKVEPPILEANTIEIQEPGTTIELEKNKKRIEQLEKTYLKKQKRYHFLDNNVIYIITTEDNKLRRNYIVGKARNLTNRLSTYNKTTEHEVVYHKKCTDEHTMNIIEASVIKKLEKYRECANRDRFILPEDADISLFTNIIDSCVSFFEE